MKNEKSAGAVYNLQGCRVNASIQKKGLYIMDGHTIFVK